MDQITLKNFRCFRQEQTARLAPLTFNRPRWNRESGEPTPWR